MPRPFFRLSCLILPLVNLFSAANAQITDEQIKEALDASGDYDLAVEKEAGTTLAIVEASNAEGNQILEATIPHAEYFKLTWSSIEVPAVIRFRYKLEASSSDSLLYDAGPYVYSQEADGPIDEHGWTHSTILLYGHSAGEVSLRLSVGSSFDQDKSDRKLQLDHLEIAQGYYVETSASPGLTIEKYPEQLTYSSGQSVVLLASPNEEGVEFLAWTDVHNPKVTSSTRTITVYSHGQFEAVAAKRYHFEDGNWLVPTSGLTQTMLSSTDEPLRLELQTEPNIHGSVYLSVEGPGFVSIKCRRLSDTASFFHESGNLADDPVSQKIYIPQSVTELPIRFRGHIELSEFEVIKETYAAIETVGMGSITGLAPEGTYPLGQAIQVTAVPEENWHFEKWTGDIESTNPTIEAVLRNPIKLTAVFYKETTAGNFTIRQYDNHPWTVSETEIQSGFTLLDAESSSLALELEGPGLLEMTTQDSRYDFALTISGTNQVIELGGNEEVDRDVFVPAGKRLITLLDPSPSTFGRNAEVSIRNLNWTPGVPLSIEASVGGTINGGALGTTVVPYNTPIQLKAVPENGYVFHKWEGASESEQTELTLQLEFPSSLRANFRKAIEGDPWVTSLEGDRLWEFSPESGWKTPDTLEPGQKALLHGVLPGPAHLRFEVAGQSFDDLTVQIDGGEASSINNGFYLSSGTHTVTIIDEQRYGRTEASFLKLTRQYPVAIAVEAGDLESTPFLAWHSNDQNHHGLIDEGETLTFTVNNAEGFEFSHWEGDLAGKSRSDSITVNSAIEATARATLGPLQAGGLLWTTQPPDNAYAEYNQHLYPLGETTFSTNLTGPGWISFRVFEYGQCTTVHLDGQEVPPSSIGREFAEWLIPIGEGDHAISIYRPEAGTSSSLCRNASVRYINYANGYLLRTGGSGGSVTLDPSGGVYDKGTSVTVNATPSPGNRFAAWEGDFAGQQNPVTQTVDSHLYAPARFEANDTVNDLQWVHTGNRPSYSEPRDAFIFLIDSETQFPQGMRTTVEGPAKLTFPNGYNPAIPYFAEVLLNGEAVVFEEYSDVLVIGPGSHEIGWQISQTPESNPLPDSIYPVYAYLPLIQTTANVVATSESSHVTITPVKESYTIGESIQVSAPSTDVNNKQFQGWWNGLTWSWLTDDADIELTVEGDVHLEARYSKFPLKIPGAIVSPATYTEKWIQDEDIRSPSDQASLTNTEGSWLSVQAFEPLTLTFKFKAAGRDSELTISREGELFEFRGPNDWHELILRLEAMEVATIDVSMPSAEDKVWLADFESDSTWSPDIFPQGPGSVVFSPLLENAKSGYIITASPADPTDFLGWSPALGEPIQTSLPFIYGERTTLTPIFDPGLVLPFGTAYQNFHKGWSIDDNPEGGLDVIASNTYHPSGATPSLRIEIEGPVLLEWEQPYYKRGTQIKLDGNIVEYPPYGYAPDTRSLQIPEGNHTLELTANFNKNQSVGIEKLTVSPGFKIADQGSEFVGYTQYSPQKSAYQIGEIVVATAIPSNGHLFDSWQSPYSGNPISFTFTFDGSSVPQATFKETSRTAEVIGLTWKISNGIPEIKPSVNYSSEVTGQELRVQRIDTDLPVAMTATVEGPTVIRIDPDISTATGIWNSLKIDGLEANKHPNRKIRRGDSTLIEIPSGKHELSFSQHHSHLDLDSSYVQLHPGYLVDTTSTGSTTTVEPLLISYPENTLMTIQAYDLPTGGEIDWQGLPAEATTLADQAEFRVNEGLSIDALFWRPIRLFALDLHYASDHPWSKNNAGGFPGSYSHPTFSPGGRSLLKASFPNPGFLTYQMSSYAAYLEIHEKINGETINTYPERDHFTHAGILKTLGPEDEIRIELRETNRSSLWAVNEFFLTSLNFQETLSETPYLSWWNQYDKSAGANQSWTDPQSDIDGDGLNAYIEYLLNLDPFQVDHLLRIAPVIGDAKSLKVRRNTVDLSPLENPEIQYANSLSGPWTDASSILLEDPEDSDGKFISFDLLTPPDGSQPLFFRLDHNTFTPTINNLVDP